MTYNTLHFLGFPSELCFPGKKCEFCELDAKYQSASANEKEMKDFIQDLVKRNKNQFNPTEIELKPKTPKKMTDVPPKSFSRLNWRDKSLNFAVCNIQDCNEIVSYIKSSKTGLYSHIERHFNEKPISRKRKKIDELPIDELPLKKKMSLILALKLIGQNKLSAFKVTSDQMISTYQAILAAAGIDLPKEDIIESRKQIMRTVTLYAEKIRQQIKQEIRGKNVTLIHDDSRSATGMNESIRAITACFIQNGSFVRRFLHLEYVQGKDSESIAQSIAKVAAMYEIENYEITADGASVNLKAAKKLNVVQGTCWTHTVHNVTKSGFNETLEKYPAFKQFWSTFEKFLEKSSRRHINSILADVENYVKIPTYCKTRWLSRRDCLASVVKNWSIIQENKNIIGLSEAQWKIFDNFQLFNDLLDIVDVAAKCLLKLEQQKITTSQYILPTISKWIFKMAIFKMDAKKTNLGRLLAAEIITKIDLYTFGKTGSPIEPRIRPNQIIQAAMNPDTHFLAKLNMKISSKIDAIGGADEIKSANADIELRYSRIYEKLWPALKSAYDKIYSTVGLNNSSDHSSDSELEWSSLGLSQEQRDKIKAHLNKKSQEQIYIALKNEVKKFKIFVKDYREWNDNLTGECSFSELIRCFLTKKTGKNDHHMIFWSMNEVKLAFPILQQIVYDTIHVPASNAAIESLYSHVTDVKNFKRSKLSSDNLNNILTLFYADLYMNDSVTNFFASNVNKEH